MLIFLLLFALTDIKKGLGLKKSSILTNYTVNTNTTEQLSQELVERIRKRKCFADKDLEKLTPTSPTQQQVSSSISTIVLEQQQQNQKFHEIYSYILGQTKLYASLTESRNKSETSNYSNAFDPASSFNTFNSFAAFYTNLLNTSNGANSPNISHSYEHTPDSDTILKKSAFHEPRLFQDLNQATDIAAKITQPVSSPVDSLKSIKFVNQNRENTSFLFNHTTSPIASSEEISKKKITNKLTNFSVEALLGVVK